MAALLTIRIWRGDGSGGKFEDFVVEEIEGEVVLDVIHRIQATQANDLAVRWNCKAGRCGSCSAEINGQPRLMCMTRMASLPAGEAVTVGPLQTFPVIRDLVTDVSFNYEMAKRAPPSFPGLLGPTDTIGCTNARLSGSKSSANASSVGSVRTYAT